MFKRFMRSKAMQVSLGWLVAAYMTLVKYTTRWEVERYEQARPIIESGKGFIGMTWHSRFMMLTAAWKKSYQQPYVLISRSRDGEIVAHTSHFLGLKTIRGSAKKMAKDGMAAKAKGGDKAGRDILSALSHDACIVITPDGPRGPRQRLGDGPLRLAKAAGVPILPCIFAVSARKQFNSWDKFVFPLPFGRGRIIWGTAVNVPKTASAQKIENIRQMIESEMNLFLSSADRAMGHDAVEPAPKKDRAKGKRKK